MTRRDQMTRRLIAANDGKLFISKSKAMRLLGHGHERFDAMMEGYDFRCTGRNGAREYFVDDVIDAELNLGKGAV